MKTVITNKGSFLFISCQNDSFRIWEDYSTFNGNRPSQYLVFENSKQNRYFNLGDPESFEILSAIKDITEEQAKSIVEKPEYGWYLTYTKGNTSYHCQTAKESLQSLIQANGLNLKNNYLILKKRK